MPDNPKASNTGVKLDAEGNITVPSFGGTGKVFPEDERKHKLHQIKSQEEFDALPNGALFTRPGSSEIFTKTPPEKVYTRAQDGMEVPGEGEGDKEPILAEPGEFVVSNDMMEQNEGLREMLQSIHSETLADLELPEGGDDFHFRRGGQKRGLGSRAWHSIRNAAKSAARGTGRGWKSFVQGGYKNARTRFMTVGEKFGEHNRDANFHRGVKLGPNTVSMSPDVAKRMGLVLDPTGKNPRSWFQGPNNQWYHYGDPSYIKPGRPSRNVVEFRDKNWGDFGDTSNWNTPVSWAGPGAHAGAGQGNPSGLRLEDPTPNNPWSNQDFHNAFGNNYDPSFDPNTDPIYQPNNPEGGGPQNPAPDENMYPDPIGANPAPNEENPMGDNEHYFNYDPEAEWQDLSKKERKAFKAEHGGSGMQSNWADYFDAFNTGGGGIGGTYRGNPSAPAWWGGNFNLRTGSTSLSNPYGSWGNQDDNNNIGEGTVLSSVGSDMGMGLTRSGEGPLSSTERFGLESAGAGNPRSRSMQMASPNQRFRLKLGSGNGPLKYPSPTLIKAFTNPAYSRFMRSRGFGPSYFGGHEINGGVGSPSGGGSGYPWENEHHGRKWRRRHQQQNNYWTGGTPALNPPSPYPVSSVTNITYPQGPMGNGGN